MSTFLYRHFPKTQATWRRYFAVFLPIIISSTVIALNGMIDNFMVGHIDQGVAALGAVNSWTNIFTGLVMATSGAGSVVLAQFFHARKYDMVRQIVRIRFMVNLMGAILLLVLVWTVPDQLIGLFMSKPRSGATFAERASYLRALDNAHQYIQITCFQWLLYAVSFDLGSQLREVGHAKITLYSALTMLIYHISLNAIFLYGLNFGIRGAAIAGATSRLIPITFCTIYIIRHKVPIGIRPWTLFVISGQAIRLVLRRYIYFLSVFTVTFFITFRNHFYDIGYPTSNDSLGVGVSGLAVLSLTSAIMNIFTTTFSAAPAMAANFVAAELGKGNLSQAKINSDEIKGFNTIVAAGLSVLLLGFSLAVPHMTFLVASNEVSGGTTDAPTLLRQVSRATMVISFWYPIWIWFVSSYRNSQSGGRGGFMAIWDWVVSGPLQIAWVALIAYVFIPNAPYLAHNFWASYFIFFTSDLLKLIGMEIYYYRYRWLHSLTHEKTDEIEVTSATTEVMGSEITGHNIQD